MDNWWARPRPATSILIPTPSITRGCRRCSKAGAPTFVGRTKVLHSDFFHTAAGDPVYLECADNYQDMRERFAALLPRLRQDLGLPAEAVLTCVIDRGVFSQEVFAQAVAAPD